MTKILLAIFLVSLFLRAATDKTYTQYFRQQNAYGIDKIAFSDDERITILYNDQIAYIYRSLDMQQTASYQWQSTPSYFETFTLPDQRNGILIAANGGDIFNGIFSLAGLTNLILLNTLQNCKLSKVSPSYDKTLFAALCENDRLVVGNLVDYSPDTYKVNAQFTVQAFQWHPLSNKIVISGTNQVDKSFHLAIFDYNDKTITPIDKQISNKIQDIEFSSDGKFIAYISQDPTNPKIVSILNLETLDPSFLIAPQATQLLMLKRSGKLLTAYDSQQKKSYVWEFNGDSYGNYNSALKRTGLSPTGGFLFTLDSSSNEIVISKNCPLPNQVFINDALACSDCQSPCKSCFLNQVQCSACEDTYYLDAGAYACKACTTDHCKLCDAATCNACLDGFYLDGDKACASCAVPYTGCLSCTSDACSKCDQTQNWILNNKQCECKAKYAKIEDQCVSCPLHCAVCTSGTSCQVCDITEHRKSVPVDGKCLCEEKYFQQPFSGECQSCILGCSICDNSITCSGCDTTNHWILNEQTKICGCQSNYLLINNQCKACNELISGCIKCQAVGICTSCMDGYDLDAGTHQCNSHTNDDGGVNMIVVIVVGVCVLIGLGIGSYFIVKMLRKRRGRKVQTLLESEAENESEEIS